MSGFLYFIPEQKTAPSAELLFELGLADKGDRRNGRVLPDHANNQVLDGRGPGGVGGWIVGPGGELATYEPAVQTWIRAERWWIGYRHAARPTPNDLVRWDMVRGTPVRLADGAAWIVPVAKLQPAVIAFEEGKWVERPDASAAQLFLEAEQLRFDVWENLNEALVAFELARQRVLASASAAGEGEIAEELIAEFMAARSVSIERCRGLDPQIAVRLLGRNYRVGAEEIGALGLLRMDPEAGVLELSRLIDAFVDGPGIREARAGKKN